MYDTLNKGVLAFRLFRIRLFRVRLFHVRLFRVRLFRVRLFRVRLFRVRLFRIRLFRVRLFRVRLFRVRLFRVRLFRIRLLRTCLFRVLCLQPIKLRITSISFSCFQSAAKELQKFITSENDVRCLFVHRVSDADVRRMCSVCELITYSRPTSSYFKLYCYYLIYIFDL